MQPTSASLGSVAAVVAAMDNSDGAVIVTFSEAQSSPGSSCNNLITRTWLATDAHGNAATCSQTILVNDTTPPSLIGVPSDAVVECDWCPPQPSSLLATNALPLLL